jgi:hypothetical protein
MKHLKDIITLFEELELPGVRFTPGKGEKRVDSWINVKADKDLHLRVSRYTRALDAYNNITQNNIEGLKERLKILSNPYVRGGVQLKLSMVLLLQYLKEIKSNFDSSSAGFLLEDYIAGLLHSRKTASGDYEDILGGNGKTYQIKFYKEKTGQLSINKSLCDYYIIALKYADNTVRIFIVEPGDGINDKGIPYVYTRGDDEDSPKWVDMTRVKKEVKPFKLEIANVDENIKRLSEDLKMYISDLYDSISNLNYNIETIITGVDKENKVIKPSEIDNYYSDATKDIDSINKHLAKVKSEVKTKTKRYE